MLDALPAKPLKFESAIVNLDKEEGPGTHWTAYKKRNKTVVYFDSFGNLQPPLELMNYFGNGSLIRYNYERYQDFDTFDCGHLCLMFLTNQL